MKDTYKNINDLKLIPFDTNKLALLDIDEARAASVEWRFYVKEIKDLNPGVVLNDDRFEPDLLKWNIEAGNENYYQYYKLYCGLLETNHNASHLIKHTFIELYKNHLDAPSAIMQMSALIDALDVDDDLQILYALYDLDKNLDLSKYFSTYALLNTLCLACKTDKYKHPCITKELSKILNQDFIFERYIKGNRQFDSDDNSEIYKIICILNTTDILNFDNVLLNLNLLYTIDSFKHALGLDPQNLKTKLAIMINHKDPKIYSGYQIAKTLGCEYDYICSRPREAVIASCELPSFD